MFILTLKGHATGVFSLVNDVGEQVIPIFEEYDDAERYHGMIVDQSEEEDIPLTITDIDAEVIIAACDEKDQKYAIITPDDLLIPPDNVVL
ncbi:hypothetical protein R1080702_144 [Cyanophage S-RIM32]|uniref:DUF3110 domain-containing protein n=1 Tax=Cyanophage S-RIM32 TaxID=1278479 RepID=A0A127KM38_9CAUD|nr:hypothetical protein BJD26_gp112 [Cyanophage S-RIM32]AMO43153.1 hypothetical protein R1080702_144 [Cyanophage S-RIM32]